MSHSLSAYRIRRNGRASGVSQWQAVPLVSRRGRTLGARCFRDLIAALQGHYGGERLELVFDEAPFSASSFLQGGVEHWWLGQSEDEAASSVGPLDIFFRAELIPVAWCGVLAIPTASLSQEDLPLGSVVRSWLLERCAEAASVPQVTVLPWPRVERDRDAFAKVQNALLRHWLASGDPHGFLTRLREREREWEREEAGRLQSHLREYEARRASVSVSRQTPRVATGEVASETVAGETLQTALATVDHATLDLFDTVFHRKVARPRDVFWLLGVDIERETGCCPIDFAELREQTENELRREWQETGRAEDVSLYPIYERLAEKLSATPAEAHAWAERELSLEDRLLAVNPEFHRWKDVLATKVHLCLSEMYLPGNYLTKWFAARTGMVGVPVWTSGDTGVSKGSGHLYERAEKHLGSPPERLLHVGDNPASDIFVPRERGWKTFHWSAAQACRLDQPARWSPEDPVASVALGVLRADRQPDAPLPWQIGFELLGPIVWAWINHLAFQPSIREADQVWLLARDGYWLERVWKAMPQAFHPPGDLRYVLASRQLWGVAAIEDISGTDWDFLLKAAPDLRVRDFFERVGIDVSDLPDSADLPWDAMATHRTGFVNPQMRDRLYGRFVEHIERFHAVRSPRRVRVLDYLHSLNPVGERVAMVDLGWHASSCENLSRLARTLGWTPPRGHYFATWREARPAALAGARFNGFFTSMGGSPERVMLLRESVALLENLFAAPHPTVTDLTLSAFQPRFGIPDARNTSQIETINAIWQGAEAFCSTMGALISRPVIADGGILAERALERLLRYPQAAEAGLFEGWPHVEGWGLRRSHPLLTRPSADASAEDLRAARECSGWRRGWDALLTGDERTRLGWREGEV